VPVETGLLAPADVLVHGEAAESDGVELSFRFSGWGGADETEPCPASGATGSSGALKVTASIYCKRVISFRLGSSVS
jgi:hypothetical protein